MAAAYTALVSLMNTIDLIQNHSRHSFSFDKNQISSLLGIARFFLEFIESFNSHGRSKEVEDLETQIASAACLAEDFLESQVLNQILGQKSPSSLHDFQTKMKAMIRRKAMKVLKKIRQKVNAVYSKQNRRILTLFPITEKSPSYLSDLEKILEDRMYSIMKKVVKVKGESKERSRSRYEQPSNFIAAASSRTIKIGNGNSTMVGFDDYSFQLVDVLTRQQPTRQIISIVGMGGIGKTTLAENIYENSVIVQHFDIRAWATISQEHNVKEILLELLSCKGESTRDTVDCLGEQLHKKLSGRRYLIVLDDIWSSEVWDEMKFFFPDNGNRSRIVVTTRLSYVASNFSSSSLVIELLDMDKSWELLCAETFGEEDCPLELVEIGKKIVEQCKGLPLSIVVIGGHLRNSSRTEEQWVRFAQDMISFLNSREEQCFSIFSLSYRHLPIYLKPCFLYMGIFREDEDILVSTLIRFWVAEGFLRSKGERSLEEIAEGYLQNLVERNLISVKLKGQNGKIRTCKTHDLLRELCLKVGEEEKFFCVLKHPAASSRCSMNSPINNNGTFQIKNSRLLRILPQPEDDWEDEFNPDGLYATSFQHFNMRYIFGYVYWHRSTRKTRCFDLPSSISLHWNLQTIIIRVFHAKVLAPREIWEMPQLRHVDISNLILSGPPPVDGDDVFVMSNLQTLLVVENFILSEEICRRIPNIKELQIDYKDEACSRSSSSSSLENECKVETSLRSGLEHYEPNIEASSSLDYCQHNLVCFHKLESLRLRFSKESNWRSFAMRLTFPDSLKELWLASSSLCWEDLSMIGLLPRLEVLALIDMHSVKGDEWNPVEGGFPRLKSLTIRHCYDLARWNVERPHFPVLETLTLGYAFELGELPSDIGDIPTLGHIYLDRCSMLAAISAMRVLVEQQELGNDELRLTIQIDDEEEMRMLMEEEMRMLEKTMHEEGLQGNPTTSTRVSNLHLKYYPSNRLSKNWWSRVKKCTCKLILFDLGCICI